MNTALQVIELFAGTGPDGKPVAERLRVIVHEDNSCELVQSPAFVKGVARGDLIKLEPGSQQFTLLKRSGNLSIRVFCRDDSSELVDELTPALEKLGGDLDIETPRMLVYSIHVSCGFQQIEKLLNSVVSDDVAWVYGNVYDPEDGETPLNWWQEILQPE
ncbi:MAG: DUF4265 domain-containing protein [Gammaproteobacteria bacterium]|uniref:DUF4265 domain-containing protein n=1 Tax=Pseudomaricurvus alcaniphilus TaxID=1166482 RepID=UPI001407617B|nr:DUF4265 domain-containing protein [Pseudomaricurvus alcaniphilus]MBR9909923.1 DUF4265 domain-containing protein [Gammaproteobacteria bacterium]NHN38859.1 DUF4265 domain-containing protein [Pseudomaricurvus alcaniphilus]